MVFLRLDLRPQLSFPGAAFQFITIICGRLTDAPDDAAPMVCDSGAVGILFGAGPFCYKSGSAARESQSFEPDDEPVGTACVRKRCSAASRDTLKPNPCHA